MAISVTTVRIVVDRRTPIYRWHGSSRSHRMMDTPAGRTTAAETIIRKINTRPIKLPAIMTRLIAQRTGNSPSGSIMPTSRIMTGVQ